MRLSDRVRLIQVTVRVSPLVLLLCIVAPMAFAKVSVTGLEGDAKKNVQLFLSLTGETCDSPAWKINSLFNKADEEIDQALRALGHYHSRIEKSLAFSEKCWQADFEISPGPQVMVNDITITVAGEAIDDPEFDKLRNTLQGEKGKPLRHDQYEKIKTRLESLAMERGYLNATFSQKQLLVDTLNNQAHINLVFDTGKRLLFGDVRVEQDILEPEFVNKLISIKSGEYYSPEPLVKTHNALSKSGYFEMVGIRPATENIQQQQVPVTIELSPKSVHHYSFGIGFDTDIGPIMSAAYNNRRLNRLGHFLDANIDLSPALSTADVEYSIPLANPVSDFLSFGSGLKREDTDSYQSLSTKLSARVKRIFASGWRETLFLDSIYEDFTAGTTSNQVLLLVPGGSWLRSVSDSTLRPTRGYRLEYNLAGSYKNPLSDVSFVQGSVSAVWTRPLPWRSRFIARTEQGATMVDQFESLPTSFRFYAGGMNSIRGYAYKELGPKDDLGNIVGGKFLSVVSAEYEKSVYENWGVAAFLDGGNSFNLDDLSINSGVGIGVRWYSPIGPIRLDVAMPLNESDSSFQIYFAAGARL